MEGKIKKNRKEQKRNRQKKQENQYKQRESQENGNQSFITDIKMQTAASKTQDQIKSCLVKKETQGQ